MNSSDKKVKAPYPYKDVLFWTFIVFLIGYGAGGTVIPVGANAGAAMGTRIALGIMLVVIVGPIIGIYKYFRR